MTRIFRISAASDVKIFDITIYIAHRILSLHTYADVYTLLCMYRFSFSYPRVKFIFEDLQRHQQRNKIRRRMEFFLFTGFCVYILFFGRWNTTAIGRFSLIKRWRKCWSLEFRSTLLNQAANSSNSLERYFNRLLNNETARIERRIWKLIRTGDCVFTFRSNRNIF